MRTRFEHSAGGVVVRGHPGALEVVLAARRNRRGELVWGLPKGIVESGETAAETAVREVREETGLVAEAREPLGDISYWYVWGGERIRKRVTFFLMRHAGGDPSQRDHEMEEVRWFPLAEGIQRAEYPSEREVLLRAEKLLAAEARPASPGRPPARGRGRGP